MKFLKSLLSRVTQPRQVQKQGEAKTSTVTSGKNPVCPRCGTIYNRAEVIRQMKQASSNFDMLYPSLMPTAKFKCIKCGSAVEIDLREE